MNTPKRTKYLIATREQPREVSGLKLGDFAAHCAKKRWVISHVPTGLALTSRISPADRQRAICALQLLASGEHPESLAIKKAVQGLEVINPLKDPTP